MAMCTHVHVMCKHIHIEIHSYVIHRQMNVCLYPCTCMCISPGGISPASEKLQSPSRIEQVLVLVNWGRDCNPMRRFWSPGVHVELPVDAVLVWADQNWGRDCNPSPNLPKLKLGQFSLGTACYLVLVGFGKLGDAIAIPDPILARWDSGLHFWGLRFFFCFMQGPVVALHEITVLVNWGRDSPIF